MNPIPSDLDHPLFYWSPFDPLPVRGMARNIVVFGQTGSGKTSGSGDFILRSVVRYCNTGGLFLASKPEDKEYVERVFREERTERDLLIMEPGGPWRCNVLDYMLRNGADTRQLTQAFITFGQTLDRVQGGGGKNEAFWENQNRRTIHSSVEVLTGATGKIDPWDVQRFITGAAMSLKETGDEDWQKQFHYQMLEAAFNKAETPIQKHDFELARTYWLDEWPAMYPETRTGVLAGVMGLLFVMNSGIVRDLLSTHTNISPATLEDRKWWLVNFPIVPEDATATFINTAVKLVVQRHILRRKPAPNDPLLVVWGDEFQKVANPYDAYFVAECRSHKGCLVALTQSIHALYAKFHGKEGEHQTDALLTNFGHVVAHTVGDARSAKHLTDILGMRRELFIDTSVPGKSQEMWDVIRGDAHISVSAREAYEPVLQPAVLLSGLRCGGPPDNTVDGVVIRSGQPFSTGENYLITSFEQRLEGGRRDG